MKKIVHLFVAKAQVSLVAFSSQGMYKENWIPKKSEKNMENHGRVGITYQGWSCINKSCMLYYKPMDKL